MLRLNIPFFSLILFLGFTHLSDFSATAVAQEDATLRVMISSDEDGSPIVGANVILTSPDDDEQEILYAGSTDNDGFVEIRNISPATYLLEVSYLGYETISDELTLDSEQTKVEQLSLEPDPAQLDEVTILEERQVTTGEVGVRSISAAEVDRVPTPGPGGDLVSYIQTLPGVVMSGDRGGQLHIRGGTPTQNHVMVDNLPVIKPFHISNMFSAFPEESMQNVDMYAGGFGSEYMGATSSVIDVTLRQGNMREFSGSAAYSPYLASIQAEGPIETDRQSFMIMGRNSVIDHHAPQIIGEDVPLEFQDLMARYSFQSGNLNCNVTGLYTYDQGRINPERQMNLSWSNRVIGGRCLGFDEDYDRPFDVTVGYTGFINTEGDINNPERSSEVHKGFFKLQHEYEIFGLPIDYGLEFTLSNYTTELSERFASYESFDISPLVARTSVSTEWSPAERLVVRPSVGTQISSQNFSNPTLEPRVRASYRTDRVNEQEFSVAFGLYSQIMEGITDERDAGTVFTVWKPSEDGDPLPRAFHGIAGFQQRIGRVFEFNLEGFVKDHRNIPVSKWTPVSQLEVETALADGFTYGFDIRTELEWHPFYLSAGYGWANVNYEAASDDLGAWIEEPVFSYSPAHDRRHQFNILGSYQIGGFTANVNWEYGSGNPYTRIYGYDMRLVMPDQNPLEDSGNALTLFNEPYGDRLPAYHSLDVSIERSFQVSPGVSLDTQVGSLNLYDRGNIFYFDVDHLQRVDQTPVLPYASLQINFN